MKKTESVTKVIQALMAFRKDLKQPPKDAHNPYFKSKYTTLDKVIEAIDQASLPHGLSFIQYPTTDSDGKIGMNTVLVHESGEMIEFDPVYTTPEKQTPQAIGSAITYLRRYAISSIFGVTSEEDDDGNHATGNAPKQQYQNKQSYQKPQQDKGKVALVQQNAEDLKKVINENAEEGKEMTTDQIISAYLKQLNINNLSSASNEQLITMSKLIKQNIEKYNK